MVELYISRRGRRGAPPKRVLLDFDSTDDPAHGGQEGVAYHGYFGQHQYHPLLVFDGDTGQIVAAVLRPGNAHAGAASLAVLKRLVGRLRSRWPEVEVEIRADAGFALPQIYEYCEAEGILYTIGLIPNARLEAMAKPLVAAASLGALARMTRGGGPEGQAPVRRLLRGRELVEKAAGGLQGGGSREGCEHPLRGDQPPGEAAGTLRQLRLSIIIQKCRLLSGSSPLLVQRNATGGS